MSPAEIKLTEFQLTVLRHAARGANGMMGVYDIAAQLPGWKKRAAHAALVAHVGRAARQMQALGLVWKLSPKDQWDRGTVAVRPKGEEYLKHASHKGN